ncbi:caffeoylshikimate esterase-like isoform X2 [Canna indica]|uniref:Caffeoylshikimate esterase-like isoform X2 n=1 Tax=Canna indica TaxID=4628 RepID=A0AAQ3KNP4_9LILI|nr:caffeoylshikimate esterase-like isoform X2 [Canna indica]
MNSSLWIVHKWYLMNCLNEMFHVALGTGTQLVNAGYAVYGIDYEGHGKSSGLQGFVPNFDELVIDCFEHFTSICGKVQIMNFIVYILLNALAIVCSLLILCLWHDGAVLVAPMCKITEEMKPSPIVIKILTLLTSVIPTWKIVPTEDIIDKAIKNPEWRKEIRNNPYCYKGMIRLKTGYELLKASLDIQDKLNEVELPFLIVHGDADSVTDPAVSQSLYESASSKDKTFKLYPGMWHALTSGEPQESINLVFSDIIEWLNARTESSSSRLEIEHKIAHDHQIKALHLRQLINYNL